MPQGPRGLITLSFMGLKLKGVGLRLIRHKYLWTIVGFIVIVGFVDTNSLWRLYELKRQNAQLREEIAQYEHQYKADTRELHDLEHSQEAIERVARVNLYMKRADEDIYIIDSTATQ